MSGLVRWWRRCGALGCCALLVWLPALAAAEDAPAGEAATPQFVVRQWAYEKLEEAHVAIDKKDFPRAKTLLDWLNGKRLNDHEQALVLRATSHIHYAQNQYAEAARAVVAMLTLNAMPPATQLQYRYTLGQLYQVQNQFEPAIEAYLKWLEGEPDPPASALHNIAVAHAQAKRFAEAVKYHQAALAKTGQVSDSWLQFMLSLRFELKQYGEAVGVLKQLLRRQPEKKNHWLQLASCYEELGDAKRAAGVMELACRAGILDQPQEILNLVQRLMYQGAYVRAARLLQDMLAANRLPRTDATLQLLANGWMYARERNRALVPLRELAGREETGAGFLKIAQIRLEQEKWEEATQALRQALARGKLANPGQAWELLGTALIEQQLLDEARQAFLQARQHEQQAKTAAHWLEYIEKRKKAEQLLQREQAAGN